MNLTIDQGNSAAKVALWDGRKAVDTSVRMRFVARDVASLWPDTEIDTAIYCTVSRRPPTMMQALRRRARRVIEFSVDTPIPLVVDYRTPATLGLDRLAAAIGAHCIEGNKGHELLVVDLGTAITYDRVTADGHYVGGNIAPGIYMRLKALNHYTARLPLPDPRGVVPPVWGDDTVSALLAGAIRGVVGELEYYHSLCGEDARVVLTGGDARRIAELLSFEAQVVPDLVSAGLNEIILLSQEKV